MFHQSSFDCMTFLPYLSLYVNILFSNSFEVASMGFLSLQALDM